MLVCLASGSLLRGTQSKEVARRLGPAGPLQYPFGSAPGGRPEVLVDVVLEPRDLAVLHLVDVLEGGVQLRATLVLALEAAGDDDRVATVVEVLRLGRELVELLRNRREHLFTDALLIRERAGRGVAAVESVVSAANRLHVLF